MCKEVFIQVQSEMDLEITNGNIVHENNGVWGGCREKISDERYQHKCIESSALLADNVQLDLWQNEQYDSFLKLLLEMSQDKYSFHYRCKKRNSTINGLVCQDDMLHILDCSKMYRNKKIEVSIYGKSDVISSNNILEATRSLEQIIKAKQTASDILGDYEVIVMDQEVSGLINAMLIGYFFEGDRIAARTSYLFNHINQFYETPIITIKDVVSKELPVYYLHDEESNVPEDVTLIHKGKIESVLTDNLSADKLRVTSNGRLRAQDYKYIPLPRIANIITESSGTSQQDILQDIASGIYCVGVTGAAVDIASGVIHANFQVGYQIKDGVIGESVDDISLSINVFEYLKCICKVGGESKSYMRYMGKGRPLQNHLVGFASPCIVLEGQYVKKIPR